MRLLLVHKGSIAQSMRVADTHLVLTHLSADLLALLSRRPAAGDLTLKAADAAGGAER
jgi:hypothetical protein